VSVRTGEDGVRILYVLQMVLEDDCRVHNKEDKKHRQEKIHE
jgi:hypothetical protein